MHSLFVSRLLAISLSLGIPNPQTIVGGINVEPTDPIAASTVIVMQTTETPHGGAIYCSGSLIAPDLIVTAAHCTLPHDEDKGSASPPDRFLVYPENMADFRVDRAKVMRVAAVVSHPRYDGICNHTGNLHDIALIRLTDTAPSSLRPADILPIGRDLKPGEKVVIAGYGQALEPKEAPSLRKFTDSVFSRYVYDLARLKGPHHRGAYFGDSGGPAFVDEEDALRLWGVFSCFNFKRGYAYYSDLRREKNWLEQTAADMGTSLRLPD